MNSYVHKHSGMKLKARSLLASFLHSSGVISAYAGKYVPWRIVVYHRVTAPERAPIPIQPGMYVHPQTFELHLQYLRTQCNVVPISDLIKALESRESLPPRTVVITFDDGWRDNFSEAFPLLKKYGLPAAIFLATDYVGNKLFFWTDVAGLLLRSINGAPDRIQDFIAASDGVLDAATAKQWKELLARSPTSDPATAADEVMLFLDALPVEKEEELREKLILVLPDADQLPRTFLTWEEIQEMSRSGISFGSHTHRHPKAGCIDGMRLRAELENSYSALRGHNVDPVPVFCYPQGNFSDQSQQVIAEYGIKHVLTDFKDSRVMGSPARLGRVGMHEDISRTAALFAARLWLHPMF